MAQHTGRQYDDDLTVGADEYNESFSTEYVDLFEPLGDDDAPIAKLKTIVLSIDWEITDDILQQLNDELQDLKDVWAGNKINLIYIQALEKIGRYIFAEKANAHPNAIKLLLTFYYDLEKIVTSVSMDDEAKKQLLLQDVKKFEQFKMQIAPPASQEKKPSAPEPKAVQKNVLGTLKAIVLSIDWEISDKELIHLSEEVGRLEKSFSESRAKLIFLQGIGALGNYIRSTKDKAHPDAFKLLHSFFEGLERICTEELSSTQEKEILLAEVDKFNAFKAVIAAVASEVVVPVEESTVRSSKEEVEEEEEEGEGEGGVIAPAFADVPEDVHGFRMDTEVVEEDIDQRVASFFGEEEAVERIEPAVGVIPQMEEELPEVSSRLDALFGEEGEVETLGPVEVATEIALDGVNVETEADDDSGEKALLFEGGELAPALAEAGGQGLEREEIAVGIPAVAEASVAAAVIPGVDVETEADDDSEEPPLPREQEGWVAPALMFSEEGYGFREAEFAGEAEDEDFDLEDRLDSFFGAEIEEATQGSTALIDDVHETLTPPETASEAMHLAEIKEVGPEGLELEEALETVGLEEMAAGAAGFAAGVTGDQVSAGAMAESQEVIFEPVGDDVEVDELPVAPDIIMSDSDLALERESLARLRECIASILDKKYDAALPVFFEEADRLRPLWKTQYVKMSFLQLLGTVCQYLERASADGESLGLLQSLSDNLELVCQRKTGMSGGNEKVLFAEMAKVLFWQQGVILSVLADKGNDMAHDAEAPLMSEMTDLFGDK